MPETNKWINCTLFNTLNINKSMKKAIILLLCVLATGLAKAQTIDNAGMESWRTTMTGFPLPTTTIETPRTWFGSDSLMLSVGPVAIGGSPWNRQLYKEGTLKRTGSYSAKIITQMEGDLGFFPGMLTNAEIVVDAGAASIEEAISFEGGQAVTEQPNTVSAWVVYKPGIDTATDTIGYDEGTLTAMAIATIGVIDSVVGMGFATITPSDTDTFTQVTATLTYTTTLYPVHTLRIIFASSSDPSAALDSSTLYVDDISMTGSPNPPPPVSVSQVAAQAIRLFPNPARNEVTIRGGDGRKLTINLLTSTGQLVHSMPITGSDRMDVSALAAGVYLYTVTDATGKTVQDGRLTVAH